MMNIHYGAGMVRKWILNLVVIAAVYGCTASGARAFDFGWNSVFQPVTLSPYGGGVPDSGDRIVQITDNSAAAAQSFIDDMGKQAVSFLSDPSLNQVQKEDEFRKLLRKSFDMQTIGRFSIGQYWKALSPEEQKEYLKLFEAMVVDVYAQRFNDYQGQKFEVSGTRPNGKKDILVTSYIVPDAGEKIQIDWRVRPKNGGYRIIDVIIEGVSMSVTQRSDFSSVIQRGGGEASVLLDHLRGEH